MEDTEEKISGSDSEKVSGGAIRELECPKCKKKLGYISLGNYIVDGAGHYLCKECAKGLKKIGS